MAEKTQCHGHFFTKHIPEEARQHANKAHEEMRKSWEAFLPPKFVEHRKQARKEMLMAARSMIDAAIEYIEE
jgi:hypothetical protein